MGKYLTALGEKRKDAFRLKVWYGRAMSKVAPSNSKTLILKVLAAWAAEALCGRRHCSACRKDAQRTCTCKYNIRLLDRDSSPGETELTSRGFEQSRPRANANVWRSDVSQA